MSETVRPLEPVRMAAEQKMKDLIVAHLIEKQVDNAIILEVMDLPLPTETQRLLRSVHDS
jgi:hypothetical protein